MSNIIVQGNEINAKQYVEKITIEGIGEEKSLNIKIIVAKGNGPGPDPHIPIDLSHIEIIDGGCGNSNDPYSSTFTITKDGIYLFIAFGVAYSGGYTNLGSNSISVNNIADYPDVKKIFSFGETQGSSGVIVAYYLKAGCEVTLNAAINNHWKGNVAGCVYICEKKLQSLDIYSRNAGGDTSRYISDTNTTQPYHLLCAVGTGCGTYGFHDYSEVYGPDNGDPISYVKFGWERSFGKYIVAGTYNESGIQVGAYGYDGSEVETMVIDIFEENGLCSKIVYGEQPSSYELGKNDLVSTTYSLYDSYLSWDSANRWYVAKKDFMAYVVAWVYQYQGGSSNAPDGELYINDAMVLSYTASAKTLGSTGGSKKVVNIKTGDHIYVYTPSENGWPAQRVKIYAMLNDGEIPSKCNVYTNTI